MQDFFGYNKDVKTSGAIASSEHAVITIGNGTQAFVQRFQAQYGREIRTIMAVGDTNIYWVPGPGHGTITTDRLVGSAGFFGGWKGEQCGILSPIMVSAGQGECGFGTGSSSVKFEGGMLETVGFSMQAGAPEITETANIRAASMTA